MIIDYIRKILIRNSVIAYALSILVLLIVSFIYYQFKHFFGHTYFILYFPAAIFVSWSAGFYPSLMFTFFSSVVTTKIFDLSFNDGTTSLQIGLYFFSSTAMAFLISKSVELVIKERDEKHHAYDDLKTKSQELIDFYNNAPIGFHVVNKNGYIEFINEAESSWIGYSPNELIGQHISKILEPEFIAVASERLLQLEECKKFENVELTIKHKNGSDINCIVNTLGGFDNAGNLTHARASLVNITDKIKEDNRLRLLSLAADQSPLSIEVTNSNIELEYVNEQFLKNCGYSWDEIKGKNPKVLSSGLTPRATIEEMWSRLKDGMSWTGELINKRKNGELYTEKVYIAPVYDKKKELLNFIALKEDITVKKRQESLIEDQRKKLIKSDQIFNNITKNIPGVIYIFKKSFDGLMTFVYASEGIYDFLGERIEMLQRDAASCFVNVHPDDLQGLIDSINWSEKDLGHWELEFRVLHPERGLVWVSGQSTPERLSDGSTVWYGNLIEVTEKKKQEELIKSQQRVIFDTSRMVALSDMASSLAHEINSPLTIILNKTRKLKKRSEVEEIYSMHDLDKIEKSTERIAKIVTALKSISYDPFSEEEESQLYSAEQLITDLLDFSGQKLKNGKINIEVSCPSNLIVKCQYKSVIQSFLNLISNAVFAVSKLEERWIKIEVTSELGMINFKFVDSGQGFDSNFVDKVMQPFYTTKEVGEGLGLGLSVALNVAFKHSGKLYIDTKAKNTTLVFSIPIYTNIVNVA